MSRNNLALALDDARPTLGEQMAVANRGSFWTPDDFAQLANHANSTAPSSATLSNTAAGYATLGGKYQFAALAGAATDYALFAYQVDSDKTLCITGVSISSFVTGAANATTASILDWALGVNSTAVSLATADSGSTYGPRRIPLGIQACLASTAIGGEIGPRIDIVFPTPLVITASRYLHVILTVPVMTATSSEVIRGAVAFNGFFR